MPLRLHSLCWGSGLLVAVCLGLDEQTGPAYLRLFLQPWHLKYKGAGYTLLRQQSFQQQKASLLVQ